MSVGASSSSSQSSIGCELIATASSRCCADGVRLLTLAKTASRTVGGICSSPAASTSVTKNGLPPVVP